MMTNSDSLSDAFASLIELEPEVRKQHLDDLATEDPELAGELLSLLDARSRAGQFLDEVDPEQLAELLRHDDACSMPERAGPFRLTGEIGRGGLGVVYAGQRIEGDFEQQVAVKLIKRGMDSEAIVRRFESERRILASLNHPNISRLIDGGLLGDGRPWFAMERINGKPITQWCQEQKLGLTDRLKLMEAVCRTVQFAHARLIVHRDLKPANVLVTPEGSVKLLDFGIAKLMDADQSKGAETMAGLRIMTRDYAAPEQLRGEPVSVATDVHALGVMLYELLTNQHPYRREGQTGAELTEAICEQEPLRPSSRVSGITHLPQLSARRLRGDLDAIVGQAMAKEPNQRYASAEALSEDLSRHLDDLPIRARGKTAWYRMGRFVRRHRLGVSATAAVILALSLGLLLAAWQAQRAAAEASLARLNEQRAEQETERALRTLDFLTELFRGGDPRRGQPVESIAELLNAGEQRARADLGEDPLLQARVLLRLAEVRYNRAEYGVALALSDGIIDQLETDDNSPPILLADAYRIAGESRYVLDDPEAEPLLQRAVALYEAVGDEDSVLRVMSSLAGVLRDSQGYAEAVALQQRLLDRSVARFGPDHPETLGHRYSLAMFSIDLGDYERAERELRTVIQGRERAPGDNAYRLSLAILGLASLLDRTGRQDQAGPLFERGVATLLERFDADSSPVADALFSQGIFLLGQNQLAEAESAFRTVTEATNSSPSTRAHGWRYLGRSLRDQGRHEEALTALTTAEAAYLELGGQSMRLQAHRAAADRGHALVLKGETEQGVAVLEAAVAGIEEVRGEHHYDLITPLAYLVESLQAADRQEAATVAARAADMAEDILGPEHLFTLQARERQDRLVPDS